MKSTLRALGAVLFCIFFATTTEADIAIDEFILVGERQHRDYKLQSYRIRATNTGARLKHVRARVTSSDPDLVAVKRGKLLLGNMRANSTLVSRNRIELRVPRDRHLGSDELRRLLSFEYRFLLRLRLHGEVRDAPIPNAVVTTSVGPRIFTTVADASGAYSLPLFATRFEEFLTLGASGSFGQEFVELRSAVASVRALHDATGVGGGVGALDFGDVPALNITHVTTALSVLAEAANGGPIENDQAFSMAQTRIDSGELPETRGGNQSRHR